MSRKKTYTYVRSMLAIRSSGRAYIQHSHSAEDLASTAAELMVYELGTKGAMEFFRKKLSGTCRTTRDWVGITDH